MAYTVKVTYLNESGSAVDQNVGSYLDSGPAESAASGIVKDGVLFPLHLGSSGAVPSIAYPASRILSAAVING